jgi:SanA protein
LTAILIRVVIIRWSHKRSYPIQTVPEHSTAIVFGAGLEKDRNPSKVLLERIQTAAWLYETGKVHKVLFSGDNRWIYYNEPLAMKETGISLGIREEDIFIDNNGYRSFETCKNAKNVFQINDAILVTQTFHLPRVLLLALRTKIDADGVIVDHEIHRLDDVLWWHIREVPATIRALIDTILSADD